MQRMQDSQMAMMELTIEQTNLANQQKVRMAGLDIISEGVKGLADRMKKGAEDLAKLAG